MLEERQEHILNRENTDVLKPAAQWNSLEVEVVELTGLNMELQLEKRNLACRLVHRIQVLCSLPSPMQMFDRQNRCMVGLCEVC